MPLDPRTLMEDAEAPSKEADPASVRDLVKLAQEMNETRAQLDEAKEEAKRLQARYDHFRKEELPQKMKEAGLISPSGKGSFTLPDGSTVYLASDQHVHAPSATKEKLYKWLKENGHEDLVVEYVHYSTLKAFVKEMTAGGQEVPFVDTYPYLVARARKPRS